jgi:hypothetical protein
MIQVTLDFVTSLVALHLRQEQASSPQSGKRNPPSALTDPSVVANAIRRLENLDCDYAKMLGLLIRGIDRRLAGETDDACDAFRRSASIASEMGLFPYQLAAEDGLLALTNTFADADSLRQQMLNHQIGHPERLERLYTVAPVKRKTDAFS